MTIRPVNTVSFRNNYNQVNFEGKKKNKNSGMQVPMAVKAIPLATMIAMSPLNDVDARNVIADGSASLRVENTVYGENTRVFDYSYGDLAPFIMPTNVKVNFYSTDGDNIPEHARLVYDDNRSGSIIIDGVLTDVIKKRNNRFRVDGVKIVNVTQKNLNGTTSNFKEYYVVGRHSTTESLHRASDNSRIGKVQMNNKDDAEVKISVELFQDLIDTMGDRLPVSTENRTTEETRSHYDIYM